MIAHYVGRSWGSGTALKQTSIEGQPFTLLFYVSSQNDCCIKNPTKSEVPTTIQFLRLNNSQQQQSIGKCAIGIFMSESSSFKSRRSTDMINIGPVMTSRSFSHSCFCLETPKKWTFSNGKSALKGAYGWKKEYDWKRVYG